MVLGGADFSEVAHSPFEVGYDFRDALTKIEDSALVYVTAQAYIWLVDDLLSEERLESILPEYVLQSEPLNMLIMPDRTNIMRVRLLVGFLAGKALAIPAMEVLSQA